MDIHQQRILILDFGSQTTQLIARRVRELGVYCEIHAYDMSADDIQSFQPNGIILSGGPQSVHVSDGPRIPHIVFDMKCPVLGICYGMQAMAAQLGGEVQPSEQREFGYTQLTVITPSALLAGINDHEDQEGIHLDVWMSHGDRVTKIPEGFELMAQSEHAPHAGIFDEKRGFYGIQFHPEVTHTRQGKRILSHFVHDICACESEWTPRHIIDDAIQNVQKHVGQDRVILGLSGGVDSAVTAALLHKAIGDQLICVFVNTGLLRLNEQQEVENTFAKHFGINLITVDASQAFYSALQGVSDPEEKRKIIGKCFIDAFEAEAKKLRDVKWLAQGTIYPDVIESAGAKSGKAALIKSHHNVGGLPEKLSLNILEPLRECFKDEVRAIGMELGLPRDLVYRHPFPGPGLGVRVLGEIRQEYVQILRKADAIFIETLRRHDWYDRVSQAFVVFLPVRSVGVIGDARQYQYVVSLRAVTTDDYMTAEWADLPHHLLAEVSNRIINEITGISRVTYDISSKPPATIEWE